MKKSGFFNRYKFIEDYVTHDELDADGRKVRKIYYNAEYYETDWTDAGMKSFRIMSVLLCVLCLAAAIFTLSVFHDGMTVIYVIMAYVLSMIMGVLMISAAFQLPKDAEPMERFRKCAGFDKLRVRSLINCCIGAYGALASAVFFLLIYPQHAGKALQYPTVDAIVSVCGLVIAGASYLCFRKLRTANVHLSGKENEWQRVSRQLREKTDEADASGL